MKFFPWRTVNTIAPAIATAMAACLSWICINIWYISVLQMLFRVLRFGTQSASECGTWYFEVARGAVQYLQDTSTRSHLLYDSYLPWFITSTVLELISGRWLNSLVFLFVLTGVLTSAALHATAALGKRYWPNAESRTHRQAVAHAAAVIPLAACGIAGALGGGLVWFIAYPRFTESQYLYDASSINRWAILGLLMWFGLIVTPAFLLLATRNCGQRDAEPDASDESPVAHLASPTVCPICHYALNGGAIRCPECGTEARDFSDIRRRRRQKVAMIPATLLAVICVSATLPFMLQEKPKYSVWLVAARWLSLECVDKWNTEGELLVLPRNHVTFVRIENQTLACIPFLAIDPNFDKNLGDNNRTINVFVVDVNIAAIDTSSARIIRLPEQSNKLFELAPYGFSSRLGGMSERGQFLLNSFRSSKHIQEVIRTDFVCSVDDPDYIQSLALRRHNVWMLFQKHLAATKTVLEYDCGLYLGLPPQTEAVAPK